MGSNSVRTSNSLLLKVGLMIVLILLMLIPLEMVKDQIRDREYAMDETIRDIESSWSNAQSISGPNMTISYTVTTKDAKGDPLVEKKTRTINPASLKYDIDAATEILHRSIYDVTVYHSTLHASGTFEVPEDLSAYKDAEIVMSFSDLRGIEGEAAVSFNGEEYEFASSGKGASISTAVRLPGGAAVLPFDMNLKIKGSESIQFKPVGKLTEVEMTSDCTTPSFTGAFLPAERNVDGNGFSANWVVSQINCGNPEDSEFGVKLLQPVTQYQQTTRSAKYGILIILLVFLAGFIVELVTKKDINIIQYLVIGLSLVLFYALLLSFSEIMSFGLSYLIAAVMTTLALTGYFRGILKSRLAYLLGALVALAYGVSFVLLQMETYALLAGTLILFVLLLVVMFFTRNLGSVIHQPTAE